MVAGSSTSQRRMRVGSSRNGSRTALAGSGISTMSDLSMLRQPAIDEPSNILPVSKNRSFTAFAGTVECCSLPRVSVNRRSTNLTSSSRIIRMTSDGVSMSCSFAAARHGPPLASHAGVHPRCSRIRANSSRTGCSGPGTPASLHPHPPRCTPRATALPPPETAPSPERVGGLHHFGAETRIMTRNSASDTRSPCRPRGVSTGFRLARVPSEPCGRCISRDTVGKQWKLAEPKPMRDGSGGFATGRHGPASTSAYAGRHWAIPETFDRSAKACRNFASTTARATVCIS